MDRVRAGGRQLEGLAGDAGVGALETFGGDQLDAGLGRLFGKILEPGLAVGIGIAQETDGLDALLFHVVDDGMGHQTG